MQMPCDMELLAIISNAKLHDTSHVIYMQINEKVIYFCGFKLYTQPKNKF